jgi:hypothetical protein
MYVTDVYFVSVFPGSCSPTVEMNMNMHHDHHDHGTMAPPTGTDSHGDGAVHSAGGMMMMMVSGPGTQKQNITH